MKRVPKGVLGLVLLGVLLLTVDFLSKAYVHAHIPLIERVPPYYPYGGIAVFQNWHGIDFSINHAANKGAAWGVLAAYQQPLLYARIGIIAAILRYLIFAKQSLFQRVGLTLISAGAIGNVLDYFLYGHVIDMLHFRFWGYTYPVFNVADAAIFCGVACILLQSLVAHKKHG
jgi:signal peptidase II